MSNHQDRRQAPLSFKDLRDLSSQIKGSGCTCHRPALWNITEHIRMILWNFFGIAKSVGTSDPSTPSRRKDMIRYSCMFAAAEKTSGQGLKVSFWWRVRVFTSLHIISISFLKEGGFPIFTYIDMCIIHFYNICVFDMTFCSDITWRTSNSHTHTEISLDISYFRPFCIPKKLYLCWQQVLYIFWRHFVSRGFVHVSYVNPQFWISQFGFSSSRAMERRQGGGQKMLGSLPRIGSQFVGLCAEL